MTAKEKEQILDYINKENFTAPDAKYSLFETIPLLDFINSLPTDPEPKPEPKFSIGAKVRITKMLSGHGYKIGEIVTIIDGKVGEWRCINDRGRHWWIREEEGELINEYPELEPTKPTIKDMYAFAEWVGYNYIRMNGFWVHKYQNQTDKGNWQSTDELFKFWCKYVFIPSTQITGVW